MLELGEEALREQIKTIGLFNTKAKNVIAAARILVDEYGGEVPAERAALEQLPGVGRKTANVVLNVAFGQPTIAVDTHIFRVANRTGLAPGKDPLAVELKLEKVDARAVPPRRAPLADPARPLHLQGAACPNAGAARSSDLCRYKPKTPPPDRLDPAPLEPRAQGRQQLILAEPRLLATRSAGRSRARPNRLPSRSGAASQSTAIRSMLTPGRSPAARIRPRTPRRATRSRANSRRHSRG